MVERVEPQVAQVILCITSFSVTPSSLISTFRKKKHIYFFLLYGITDGEEGLYRADVNNLLDVDPLEPIRLELDEEEDSAVYIWLVAL